MKSLIIDTIKTTNTIVFMNNNKIKWAKCRHTGRFIKHSIAIEEMSTMTEMEQQNNTYAKINLSIVFIALFVAFMLMMKIETIDVVLSTLSAIGFLSIAIVVTNKKEDVLLF